MTCKVKPLAAVTVPQALEAGTSARMLGGSALAELGETEELGAAFAELGIGLGWEESVLVGVGAVAVEIALSHPDNARIARHEMAVRAVFATIFDCLNAFLLRACPVLVLPATWSSLFKC